jgi:hypothetical protein
MPAKTEAAPLTEHESSSTGGAPISALRSGSPVLSKPGNYSKPVPLTYEQFRYAFAKTELVEMKGRGHALTIDSGWQEVADTALAFIKRFV